MAKPMLKVWMFNVMYHVTKGAKIMYKPLFIDTFFFNLKPHMLFIPCGFTRAKRGLQMGYRATDARQVHKNTGGPPAEPRARSLSLCLSRTSTHTDEFTGQVGGLTWTEMNTCWDQRISFFNCPISLIMDILLPLVFAPLLALFKFCLFHMHPLQNK